MNEQGQGFKYELIAMIAVISISSWHVGNYMSNIDGWVMASIMGAVLGFCNFIMAHNIFKQGSTSKVPSFVGLIFFAVTSTWMQYTYFNNSPEMPATYFLGINIDALFLGLWAPAAEVLLGWVYAANNNVQPSGTGIPPQSLHSLTTQYQPVTRVTPLTNTFLNVTSNENGVRSQYKVENPNGQQQDYLLDEREHTVPNIVADSYKPQKNNVHIAESQDIEEDGRPKLEKAERLVLIQERLKGIQDEKAVPVKEWAEEFAVSRQTIYRDIEEVKKEAQQHSVGDENRQS